MEKFWAPDVNFKWEKKLHKDKNNFTIKNCRIILDVSDTFLDIHSTWKQKKAVA